MNPILKNAILFTVWVASGLLGTAIAQALDKRPIRFTTENIRFALFVAIVLMGGKLVAEYLN
jgi:uncharacterized membrane protein YccF (DUF307 family)